jgi:menaquinone-dependent protoporphyrinogen oxidase
MLTGLTRREFFIDSTRIGWGFLGTLTFGSSLIFPNSVQASKVTFPESSCGKVNGNGNRILVTYASQCGSTGDVAEAIGQVLCENGNHVDILLIKNVQNISVYRAIIVGSAIQRGKWLPEALNYVKNNRESLSRIPVAYFLTCLTMCNPNSENRRKAKGFLNPLKDSVPEIQPVDIGAFAGALDYSKLSGPIRMILKAKGLSEGDFRNWDDIRSWARGLGSKLKLA